jgi:predicted metalloprotease
VLRSCLGGYTIIGGEKIKEGFKIMGIIIIKVGIIKEDITKVARTKEGTIKEGKEVTIQGVTTQVPRTKEDTIKAVTTLMDDKDSYNKIKKKVKDMNQSQNSLL